MSRSEPPSGSDPAAWWRHAVIYEVYVRSFADSDGDGVGDLPGITSRLDHVAALGADAVWLTPFYPSPWIDGGYDVASYTDVDPALGTLADAEALVARAHELGLRVMVDVVPNHTSDRHPWFTAALAAGPGSPERELYVFREGLGPDGATPPSPWISIFGGSAWQRVDDGSAGGAAAPKSQWYLHMFAPEQPDLNWANPVVGEGFTDILRFWLDRGVDGFRIDVADALVKDLSEPLRSLDHDGNGEHIDQDHRWVPDHPLRDREEVHDVYRRWRTVLDEYSPPRAAVGEAWLPHERRVRYTRADELHQAFDFDLLLASWEPASLRSTITASLAAAESVRSVPTWVLSNHDVVRHRTRYALPPDTDLDAWLLTDGTAPAPDDAAGAVRGRAATLLALALPGSAYLYQGDELGLPEVADLPRAALADPKWWRSDGSVKGRDGCRVPLPWTVEGASHGFSTGPSWLPQPPSFGAFSVAAQTGDPGSTLETVRRALAARRTHGGDGTLTWLSAPGDAVLAFRHSRGLVCTVNLGAGPVDPPAGEVLVASAPLEDGRLPADAAVWTA